MNWIITVFFNVQLISRSFQYATAANINETQRLLQYSARAPLSEPYVDQMKRLGKREPSNTSITSHMISWERLIYEIEHIHARYAHAPYCNSIVDYYRWNCKSICSSEASNTQLKYVQADPNYDQVIHVTFNHDLKSIYVAFRGLKSAINYKTIRQARLSKVDWNSDEPVNQSRNIPHEAMIHLGLKNVYSDQRAVLLNYVLQLALEYPSYSVIFTGHSTGGAYALLAAVDFFDQYGMYERISVFAYGSPRVGNAEWCNYVNSLPFSSRYYRIAQIGDTVFKFPRRFFGYSDKCGNLVQYYQNTPKFCKWNELQGCERGYNAILLKDNDYYRKAIGSCS